MTLFPPLLMSLMRTKLSHAYKGSIAGSSTWNIDTIEVVCMGTPKCHASQAFRDSKAILINVFNEYLPWTLQSGLNGGR